MKKKLLCICIITAVLAMLCAGCGTGQKDTDSTQREKKTEEKNITGYKEADLKGILEGIENHYILLKAKNIDYTKNVTYDEDIVKDVKAKSGEVNLDKTGTYTITYVVKADEEKLKDYLDGKKEEKDSFPISGEEEKAAEQNNEKQQEEQTQREEGEDNGLVIEINIDKEIEVVDKEKAEELAEKGETVWTDDNAELPKPEESQETEDNQKEEKTETAETGSTSGGKAPAGSQGNASASSGNSGGGSSGGSSKPAHVHSWTTVAATGHYETQVVQVAWDEPVYEYRNICNNCGADITGREIEHDCRSSYHCASVQTGSVHHDAVTKQVWVQDSPAYNVCSGCGAKQ